MSLTRVFIFTVVMMSVLLLGFISLQETRLSMISSQRPRRANNHLHQHPDIEYEDDDDDDNEENEKEKNRPTKPVPKFKMNVTMLDRSRDLFTSSPEAAEVPLAGGVHLLTSFYRGTYSATRFKEILYCLRRNLANADIAFVHILYEDVDPATFLNRTEDAALVRKLIRVNFRQQPNYKDFFDYARLFLPPQGAATIITNSDIYFDETVHCARAVLTREGKEEKAYFALSRHPSPHEYCARGGKDYCEGYKGSHDAFVFENPMSAEFANKLNFPQNRLGAENVVVHELHHLGRDVVHNPCKQIKAYHTHCSHERTYKRGVRISRGKGRIGDHDRHGDQVPGRVQCPWRSEEKKRDDKHELARQQELARLKETVLGGNGDGEEEDEDDDDDEDEDDEDA